MNNKIKEYILKNSLIEISVLNLGAILHKFIYKDTNIVLSYDDISDYIENPIYLGAMVGRVAGRISNAKFQLNGKTYELDNNESNYSIHGGYTNLSKKYWNVKEYNTNNINPYIIFSTVLEDGDSGYPGRVEISIKYILISSSLRIEIFAKTNEDTIVNITNHSYFNLNTNKENSIKNHQLKINADEILANEENGVPFEIMSVEGTDFDLREYRELSILDNLTDNQSKHFGGYDHAFILNGRQAPLYLKNDKLELQVNTSYPSIVVYSGNAIGDELSISGTKSYNHQGIAIESQYEPDFINKDFLEKYILRKGEDLIEFIEFTVS